ncbi:Rid family detoxifying hydrolase [Moraxella nonliquefaciens]|jgi:putative endoribonuclease L-PSP|uniref:Reactive intermediate/imine deaminase n=1 Tax=Moraxella nonliquefaciens TaxID=478 RepID=A0A1B8PJ60_MORNO|nr:Rid family detoxifying hydrolase [Moraxella nonliquefaciens]MCG7411291.1 Rid family detoxifying hydrolase [Moraxella nonliquefaciens]MDI4497688.1 RidA family protein [Moraxella nonliquefaciens]MDI4499540.1 RidA family protein [Moraxella nonliquefaciens]OBX49923.1 reactive intermediate/imine deaminase [Moraxella nonliquefaciens]OBX50221.1 reactive intermediate/imine deaminase [Moraxella nonliquefaciens]
MPKQIIHTNDAPKAVGTYSQAVKVGNTVYISGQIGLDPVSMTLRDGFVAQAKQVFDNIEAIAQASGGSLADVVKFNVSLDDLNDFDELNQIFESRLTAPYPARAALEVAALPKGALVEIEAILYIE